MFENVLKFFKKLVKTEKNETNSKDTAKERLHLVLMQDRANVSADFLELMKQEIIEVIKKYIEVEENAIDVRLTNEVKEDGTTGAPSLYANIPILNIKNGPKIESAEQKIIEEKKIDSEKCIEPQEVEKKDNEELKKESNKEEKIDDNEQKAQEIAQEIDETKAEEKTETKE